MTVVRPGGGGRGGGGEPSRSAAAAGTDTTPAPPFARASSLSSSSTSSSSSSSSGDDEADMILGAAAAAAARGVGNKDDDFPLKNVTPLTLPRALLESSPASAAAVLLNDPLNCVSLLDQDDDFGGGVGDGNSNRGKATEEDLEQQQKLMKAWFTKRGRSPPRQQMQLLQMQQRQTMTASSLCGGIVATTGSSSHGGGGGGEDQHQGPVDVDTCEMHPRNEDEEEKIDDGGGGESSPHPSSSTSAYASYFPFWQGQCNKNSSNNSSINNSERRYKKEGGEGGEAEDGATDLPDVSFPPVSSGGSGSSVVTSLVEHHHLQQHQHAQQEDRMSIISAATSDRTPVVCNRNEAQMAASYFSPSDIGSISEEQPKRQEGPAGRGRSSRRKGHKDDGGGGDDESGAVGGGTCSNWKDLFDYRTYQGKVALLLVVIFVLAIVTIVGSSMAVRRSSSSSTGSDVADGGNNATTATADSVDAGTEIPVDDHPAEFHPTPSPTLVASATAAPTLRGSRTTTVPTTVAATTFPSSSVGEIHLETLVPGTLPSTTLAPTLPFPSIIFSPIGFEPLRGEGRTVAADDADVDAGADDGGEEEEEKISDSFGNSVALSADGRVLAVGARDADAKMTSKALQQRVDSIESRAGLVNVYVLTESAKDDEGGEEGSDGAAPKYSWRQRGASLSGRAAQDNFGTAVAVSSDGSILVVGEPGSDVAGDRSGNVRAFRYSDQDDQYLPLGQELGGSSPMSYFGASVALSADGRRLAVGGPSFSDDDHRVGGMVQVYELSEEDANDPEWEELGGPLLGTDDFDWLGSAVDLSEDGLVLAASAPLNSDSKGYVRLWKFDDEEKQWIAVLEQDLVNDHFGPGTGHAASSDRFGNAISLSKAPDREAYRIAIGAPMRNLDRGKSEAGLTLVYEVDPANGYSVLLGKKIMGGDKGEELGYSVRLLEGNFLAVGSPGAVSRTGSVGLYKYDSTKYEWERNNSPSFIGEQQGDDFGYSIAVALPFRGSLRLAVGAIAGNNNEGYVASYQQI